MLHLVNETSEELIKVPEGENSIGRGALLKVTDKRVSRNHALLLQQSGKLKLCPKHRNPCFYKEAGKDSFIVLQKDRWQELHHGDRFSLLPEDLVFRVEDSKRTGDATISADDSTNTVCDPIDELLEPMDTEAAESTTTGMKDDQKSTETKACEPSSERASSLTDRPVPKLESTKTETVSDTVPISAIETTISKSHSGTKTLESASSVSSVSSTKKPRSLPGWLSGISTDNKPPPKKRKAPAKKPSVAEDGDTDPPPPKKVAKTATEKRAKEDSAPAKPKPKTDPKAAAPKKAAAVADATGDGKAEATAKVKGRDATELKKATGTKTDKTITVGEKKLPLCPYGEKCYRKNPAHFREYSHDFSTAGDSASSGDEADSDKPECPYGTDCYRKNPAHLREFKHTAPPTSASKATGSRRSSRKTKGKRVSALAGDSDDDSLPNTYDYTDSFLDDEGASEGSSTSYGGESEDSDWAPPAAGDSEDVSGLVADAKAFISNKKMRKPT